MIQDMTISGLIDLLSRRYHVVCFDRPGFGHSTRTRFRFWTPEAQAELFVEALPKLGISNPVVLGHSWGTLVAVALGLRRDYPIRGVALASGYYFPSFRVDFWLLSGPAVPVFGDILRYTLAPLLGLMMLPSILRRLFAPRSVPEDFKRGFPFSLALRPKQLRAAAEESAYLIPATTRLQREYQNISCPVRLMKSRRRFASPKGTTPIRTRLRRGFAMDEMGFRAIPRSSKSRSAMSALGQKQTSQGIS
jgi:pimeloyl-ACP methyl ester carboxylesterase